nr:MAG TPA: hypothetical protein [Caudoviricetes sp.]
MRTKRKTLRGATQSVKNKMHFRKDGRPVPSIFLKIIIA